MDERTKLAIEALGDLGKRIEAHLAAGIALLDEMAVYEKCENAIVEAYYDLESSERTEAVSYRAGVAKLTVNNIWALQSAIQTNGQGRR